MTHTINRLKLVPEWKFISNKKISLSLNLYLQNYFAAAKIKNFIHVFGRMEKFLHVTIQLYVIYMIFQ